MSGCLWRNDRRRFPWIYDKTQSFASAIAAVSIEIWSNGIAIFFTVKPKRKFPKQNKIKTKAREAFKEICRQVQRQKLQLKNAASCRLSSEFEGDKNGFHQFNKNPKYQSAKKLIWTTTAGKVPRLKTKLIWNSAFWGIAPKKSQNKPPSRIPTAIS